MKKLAGKTALVTGSESGIGKGIAIEFARQGANVVITYFTDQASAKDTLMQVLQAGTRGIIMKVDVRREDDVKELFKGALQYFGQIDILVNSAGRRGVEKPLYEMSLADFENTLRTNLFSAFLCCKAFVQHRLALGGQGRIINISSIHEDVVSPGKTDYCTSKSGLRGLCRALAMEVADKQITVNNIAPGMILTAINQRAIDDPDYRREQEQRIPAKVAGTPEDVAKAAVFLASDDAAYITGTTQFVDGGLMLNRAPGAR